MAKSREQYIAENSESNYDDDLISFSLIDEDTIKRREREGDVSTPFMRTKKYLDIPKDERWNTKQLNSKLLQGILNGDPIPKIAQSFLDVVNNNESAAMRNARTMITQAECGGRQDSYENLAEQGVIQKKVWIATPDDRTRESHIEIDGEEVDIDDNFSNGCAYPADPAGDAEEVYNCRCSMRTHIIGFRRDDGTIVDVGYDRDKTLHDKQMAEEKERRGIEQEHEQERSREAEAEELHGDIEEYERLKTRAENNHITHKEVETLKNQLSDDEIIDKLAGGDMTKGSCASLALSYCGNKAGLDVTDYRDGKSREMFSHGGWKNAIKTADADVQGGVVNKEATGVAKELKNIDKNTEYMLVCGKHAAIIKDTDDGGLQYLEMQSKNKNGWHPFSYTREYTFLGREVKEKHTVADTLHERFGCRKSVGGTYTLAPVKSFKNTKEFRDILGYINTDKDKQHKGEAGSVK